METLHNLFEETLKDIYYAEKTLLKGLPKMAKKASSQQLAKAFTHHHAQTETHVTRLEEVFKLIDKKPQAKKCPAMDGLLEEAEEIMTDAKDDTVRDAGMLAVAQAVEHYEISRYGTLMAWAEKLHIDGASALLGKTLAEEKETDMALSKLADSEINVAADDDDEDERETMPAPKKMARKSA